MTTKKATGKRRAKKNALPSYPMQALPKEPASPTIDIAAELPESYNALAGGIPKWEDPLLELSPTAYIEQRRCLAVKKAIRKLAIRVQKLNWTIVAAKTAGTEKPRVQPSIDPNTGEPPPVPKMPQSPLVQAVKEIFGQIRGWSDLIEHFTGSLVEGTRFAQIKTLPARAGSMQDWKVPDFWLGTRHRVNAGGDIEWDGGKVLRQIEKTTGIAERKAKDLPRDQFAIHRPGPGSNPEGDLDLGVAIYNGVTKPWNRGITSGDLWVRLFAIPAMLCGAKVDKSRADTINARFQQIANTMQEQQGTGKPVGLSDEHMVKLLEGDPAGLTGIVAWQQYLEGICDDALTLAALTSSAGVAQADRTGNTSEQKDNEDEAAFAVGVQIAETFNRDIKPWIDSRNDLPDPGEGEGDWYLWPKDPNEDDAQDVTVEDEGALPDPLNPPQPMVQNRLTGLAAIIDQKQGQYMKLLKEPHGNGKH